MMKQNFRLDSGTVQIHKKAIAEIAMSAVEDMEGVRLAEPTFPEKFLGMMQDRAHPSIDVIVQDNNEVTLEIRVVVRYGLHIPDVARQIQDNVHAAIKKTIDIILKDVNVNILGIERGEK
jgi:uncharacterized alkaline shock family protein YloU